MKVYLAMYNNSWCESAPSPIGIYKTIIGAENALREHRDKLKMKWEKQRDEDDDREYYEEFPWDYDQAWFVRDAEVEE